jgi:hypothetical protein
MSLCSKKAKKSKILNSVRIEKKYFEKKFFDEVLISIRRINVQKISQIIDGHWLLGRFLQKTALKKDFFFKISTQCSMVSAYRDLKVKNL